MALLRHRAIAQVRREFEQKLHRQMRDTRVPEIRGERSTQPRPRTYDA